MTLVFVASVVIPLEEWISAVRLNLALEEYDLTPRWAYP